MKKLINKIYKSIVIGSRKRKLGIKNKTLIIGKKVFVDKSINFKCGKNCWIGRNVSIFGNGTIEIGNNVRIGDNCTFHCTNSIIKIGDFSLIASDCFFITNDHNFSDKNLIIQKQGNSYGDIVVGEDCWIGQNATILKSSIIENKAIIGAKSLVKGKIPEAEIYAGIPAKFIKKRFSE